MARANTYSHIPERLSTLDRKTAARALLSRHMLVSAGGTPLRLAIFAVTLDISLVGDGLLGLHRHRNLELAIGVTLKLFICGVDLVGLHGHRLVELRGASR